MSEYILPAVPPTSIPFLPSFLPAGDPDPPHYTSLYATLAIPFHHTHTNQLQQDTFAVLVLVSTCRKHLVKQREKKTLREDFISQMLLSN